MRLLLGELWARAERNGQDRVRADGTCRWRRGARLGPTPPLGCGAGNPAPPPLLAFPARPAAHRGSGRGARAWVGGALTSLASALRSSGRRGQRCPSVSLRTGTRAQPRLSGNAAADADPARGAERSRGGGRAGRGRQRRAGGAPGARRPPQVFVPGLPAPSPACAPPARAPALSGPAPATAAPRALPRRRLPLPRRGQDPFPLCLAEIPSEFLGRTFIAKGSETHKDAGRGR